MAARLAGVFEHGHVLGAADDEGVEPTQGRRFVHPVLGGLLPAGRIGHPDTPAAGTAAERIVAAARHLDQFAADQFEHPARLVVMAVEPAQMARVVERHPLAERLGHGKAAAFQERGEHARVVADRRYRPVIGIFVADRVVAVRIRGHDLREPPRRRHRRQIVLGQGLEQPLLAHPAHVVAGVPLAFVEQAEIDSAGAEQPRDRPRDRLVARVVGGVVTDEPEMFGGHRPDVLDGEFERRRPAGAGLRALAEAVAAVGDGVEGVAQLPLHGAVFDQAAAHLHDHRRVFDPDRTDLHAGAAGATGPQRLGLEHRADERSAAIRAGLRGAGAQVEDQVTRAERRAGGGRRACLVAAAALGAGVEIEQVLP